MSSSHVAPPPAQPVLAPLPSAPSPFQDRLATVQKQLEELQQEQQFDLAFWKAEAATHRATVHQWEQWYISVQQYIPLELQHHKHPTIQPNKQPNNPTTNCQATQTAQPFPEPEKETKAESEVEPVVDPETTPKVIAEPATPDVLNQEKLRTRIQTVTTQLNTQLQQWKKDAEEKLTGQQKKLQRTIGLHRALQQQYLIVHKRHQQTIQQLQSNQQTHQTELTQLRLKHRQATRQQKKTFQAELANLRKTSQAEMEQELKEQFEIELLRETSQLRQEFQSELALYHESFHQLFACASSKVLADKFMEVDSPNVGFVARIDAFSKWLKRILQYSRDCERMLKEVGQQVCEMNNISAKKQQDMPIEDISKIMQKTLSTMTTLIHQYDEAINRTPSHSGTFITTPIALTIPVMQQNQGKQLQRLRLLSRDMNLSVASLREYSIAVNPTQLAINLNNFRRVITTMIDIIQAGYPSCGFDLAQFQQRELREQISLLLLMGGNITKLRLWLWRKLPFPHPAGIVMVYTQLHKKVTTNHPHPSAFGRHAKLQTEFMEISVGKKFLDTNQKLCIPTDFDHIVDQCTKAYRVLFQSTATSTADTKNTDPLL